MPCCRDTVAPWLLQVVTVKLSLVLLLDFALHIEFICELVCGFLASVIDASIIIQLGQPQWVGKNAMKCFL